SVHPPSQRLVCAGRVRFLTKPEPGGLQSTQNKGPAEAGPVRAIQPLRIYITASLRSFEARKAIFLLALILMASPVAGLRPMRAARFLTCRLPRPEMRLREPVLRCLPRLATRSFRMVFT